MKFIKIKTKKHFFKMKKIEYKIIDNFLLEDEFKIFEKRITEHAFPWYFNTEVNHSQDEKDLSFYLTHLVYYNSVPLSDIFKDFNIILDKINLKSLIRIKINCYPSSHKIREHSSHVDYPFKHKGILFSINDCDGYTLLNDGTKIQSKRNRALFFDSSIPHQSTTCTNVQRRMNININYL